MASGHMCDNSESNRREGTWVVMRRNPALAHTVGGWRLQHGPRRDACTDARDKILGPRTGAHGRRQILGFGRLEIMHALTHPAKTASHERTRFPSNPPAPMGLARPKNGIPHTPRQHSLFSCIPVLVALPGAICDSKGCMGHIAKTVAETASDMPPENTDVLVMRGPFPSKTPGAQFE